MLKFVLKSVFIVCLVNLGILLYEIYKSEADILSPDDFFRDQKNKHGYSFEKHTVTTEDGYILELHRIPYSKKSKNTTNRPAILLKHGILGNSLQWMVGLDKNLPFYLADRGYDVWISNDRGTTFSRKHTNLNADKDNKKFYNFSFHEIGYYDLPAVIDYVINATKQEKIYYTSHSQGCIAFFVMMSDKPEYNEKIKVMVGLAPVVYVTGIKSWILRFAAFVETILEWLSENYNMNEMQPMSTTRAKVSDRACNENSLLQRVCTSILHVNVGYNYDKINKTTLPLYLSNSPSGTSMKQVLHYAQIYNTDIFMKYDYGESKNYGKYGQKSPPLYNLKNVKVPVALFYGNNDRLTTERNVYKLAFELPNVVHLKKVDDENFAHIDFMTSTHASDILYPEIVAKLSLY